MQKEQFRWLAGVIAAHQARKVVGRMRLQMTIYLLQRKALPTSYSYSLHCYGPYCEGLNSELRLIRQLGLIEEVKNIREDNDHSIFQAKEEAVLPELVPYASDFDLLQAFPDVVLELAATYDAFRQIGYSHPESLERLRRKKGTKCTAENELASLSLLRQLGLPVG